MLKLGTAVDVGTANEITNVSLRTHAPQSKQLTRGRSVLFRSDLGCNVIMPAAPDLSIFPAAHLFIIKTKVVLRFIKQILDASALRGLGSSPGFRAQSDAILSSSVLCHLCNIGFTKIKTVQHES